MTYATSCFWLAQAQHVISKHCNVATHSCHNNNSIGRYTISLLDFFTPNYHYRHKKCNIGQAIVSTLSFQEITGQFNMDVHHQCSEGMHDKDRGVHKLVGLKTSLCVVFIGFSVDEVWALFFVLSPLVAADVHVTHIPVKHNILHRKISTRQPQIPHNGVNKSDFVKKYSSQFSPRVH